MCENETFKCKYTHVHVHCTQQCITFTHNLPDSNAMLLPGRVPGYEESDVKLLASTIIKHTGGSVVVMISNLSAEQWSHHAFENRPEEEKSTASIHASVVW